MFSHSFINCNHSLLIILQNLWFHGPVRPQNAHNHLLVRTYPEWTVYGCVWGVSITVVQFPNIPLLDSNTIDRPFIKWWNWNASQSGLFYSSDRKYWGDGRQEKGALYSRLTSWSIFPVFLGDNIGLITSDKIIIFVPLHDFHLKLPTPSLKKLED